VGNTVHEINGIDTEGYTVANTYAHDIFTGSVFEFRSMGYNRIGVIDFSQILAPIGEPGWASLSRKHYPKINDVDGIDKDDVLGRASVSTTISSSGVEAEPFAVLYYQPAGSALDQLPIENYSVKEVVGQLSGPSNEGQNPLLLPLILEQIESVYAQSGFASEFSDYFEAYLLDIDPDTPEAQRYSNCNEVTIDTIEQAFWCGPSQTWPQFAYNHAYIEFWHHLDAALSGDIVEVNVDQITGLSPALINDDVWSLLFNQGLNNFSGITVRLSETALDISPLKVDQQGNTRPVNLLGDIGAIETDSM
jgi:hypothetical protein